MSFLTQPITIQSLFGTKRKIGDLELNVVVSETTSDVLTITKQPVQQGTSITEHAYKEPTVFTMQAYFEDNLFLSLSKVYEYLLTVQNLRIPIDIITPKRIYRNYLIAALGQTTDRKTENCLAITFGFQEVLIVNVTTTQVPRKRQRNPGGTGATQSAGKKSALLSAKQGIGALIP